MIPVALLRLYSTFLVCRTRMLIHRRSDVVAAPADRQVPVRITAESAVYRQKEPVLDSLEDLRTHMR